MSGARHHGEHAKPFVLDEAGRAKLVQLLKDGKSSGEIGAAFGVSRHAIIGKLHRDKSLPRLARSCGEHHPKQALKPVLRKVSLPATETPWRVKVEKTEEAPPAARPRDDSRQRSDMALMARAKARRAIEQGLMAPPKVTTPDKAFKPGYMGQVARITDIMQLRAHHCRFPIDLLQGGVGYCGATVVNDKTPWCAHHAKRCLNPHSTAMLKHLSKR